MSNPWKTEQQKGKTTEEELNNQTLKYIEDTYWNEDSWWTWTRWDRKTSQPEHDKNQTAWLLQS